MSTSRYRIYSNYLKEKYGSKVYKIPINLPVTCPNRDNKCGTGGCIFCGDLGAGYESLSSTISVKEQLINNIQYIGNKYKADKYIAYFQNYSNTYIKLEKFKEYTEAACLKDVVAISVSTRPDCINEKYLEHLNHLRLTYGVDLIIELGLQTVNYKTLSILNRGHGLAEFIDAVTLCKKFNIDICCHMIPDLPWDNMEDIVEGARIISALGIKEVKLHSLYIVKGTVLEGWYNQGKVQLVSMEDYIERVVAFLEYLDPQIIIQRLIGRAPEENTITVNWNRSWWKIKEDIERQLEEKDTWQGKKFNYLKGKAIKDFFI